MVGTALPADAAGSRDQQWGQRNDVPVPRDYDGDAKADFAVWRPIDGYWHILGSVSNVIRSEQWGQFGDIPVPGDFDHDGRPDFVVWRPANGNWYIKSSATGVVRIVQWGVTGDIPLAGDFDGDGVADYAVYRPSTGYWHIANAFTGQQTSVLWGQPGDVPVAGDFDGTRGDDFTVWRPSTGEWWTLGSQNRLFKRTYQWGQIGDTPLAAQFGCSRKAGQTIWRGSNGQWWIWGLLITNLGSPSDVPVPADYLGDHAADYAVWNPNNGVWSVRENDKNVRPCNDRWDEAGALVEKAKDSLQGISVAAVKNGQIVWTYSAGMANFTHPATDDIPWQLASLSKLFVGTAVLQQINAGTISMDGYSGSNLTNYWSSYQPSIRQYANHTSGLRGAVCTVVTGLEPSSNLGVTLDPCLFWWPNVMTVWDNRPPGVYEYSNLGAAWPARKLEMVTGKDFAQYTRERIFAPLGMTSTGWFAYEFGNRPIAASFVAPGAPSYAFGVSPYAIGNLRSSANDLARFMIMWTNDGVAFGTRVLAPGTVAAATTSTPAAARAGFYWHRRSLWTVPTRSEFWNHDGSIEGVCTRMDIDPIRKDGVVILTNGKCDQAYAHIDAIEERVLHTLELP